MAAAGDKAVPCSPSVAQSFAQHCTGEQLRARSPVPPPLP